MHHLLPKYNWLGIDMKELINKTKNLKLFFSSIDTYHSIAQKVNKEEILQSLKNFLNTKKYI